MGSLSCILFLKRVCPPHISFQFSPTISLWRENHARRCIHGYILLTKDSCRCLPRYVPRRLGRRRRRKRNHPRHPRRELSRGIRYRSPTFTNLYSNCGDKQNWYPLFYFGGNVVNLETAFKLLITDLNFRPLTGGPEEFFLFCVYGSIYPSYLFWLIEMTMDANIPSYLGAVYRNETLNMFLFWNSLPCVDFKQSSSTTTIWREVCKTSAIWWYQAS